MRYDEIVPDEHNYWYYHEPTGAVFHNVPEYGWCTAVNLDDLERRLDELKEAVGGAKENGFTGDGTYERVRAWYEASR